jgi:hypothetical protein
VKVTLAVVFPPVAVPIVGMPGTVAGVEETMLLKLPCPIVFTAATSKLYAWPFVRPVTVCVVEVDAAWAKIVQVLVEVG